MNKCIRRDNSMEKANYKSNHCPTMKKTHQEVAAEAWKQMPNGLDGDLWKPQLGRSAFYSPLVDMLDYA